MDEIKLPESIARVVVEALGWMHAEGQSSGDQEAEDKLDQWLQANYPQFDLWWLKTPHTRRNTDS